MKDQIKLNNSREIILSKLRSSVSRSWEDLWPDNIPTGDVFESALDPLSLFKEKLEEVGGKVLIERDEKEAWNKLSLILRERGWKQFVVSDPTIKENCLRNGIPVVDNFVGTEDTEVSLTGCEALIAITGSVMVSSSVAGRKINVYPSVHLVLARKEQLVQSIEEGFERIEKRYDHRPSQISLISGPSRTADIEKTLVMGAHGPRELIVLIYN